MPNNARPPVLDPAALAAVTKKRNKYNAAAFWDADGTLWHSEQEHARWGELQMLELAGEISGLKRQVSFTVLESFVVNGHRYPGIGYTPDFVYLRGGERIAEEWKGKDTDASRLRRKLFAMRNQEYRLEVHRRVKK